MSTRSEIHRQTALIHELHENWEDQLERSRILSEINAIELNILEPLLARAEEVPFFEKDGKTRLSWGDMFERGLATLEEVLDAIEAWDARRPSGREGYVLVGQPRPEGTGVKVVPETFAQRAAREDEEDRLAGLEVIIELDACGDLDSLLSDRMEVWLRRVNVGGSSAWPASAWPAIEIRGRRADVAVFIEEHWGEDMIADLEEAGEL